MPYFAPFWKKCRIRKEKQENRNSRQGAVKRGSLGHTVANEQDFYYGKTTNDGMKRGKCKNDKSTVRLLGQEISVKQNTLKIRHFEDLSNGFTPRLHLLKVDYPIIDESTLCDAGCLFLWMSSN